jgi:uncharacterized membrane protein
MSKEQEYSLVVAAFKKKDSAEYVYNTLLDMQNADMVKLKTVSTVYRDKHGKLKVYHKHGLTTWKGAAGGVAIGFLLGGPLLGGAIGALVGSRGKGEQRKAKKFLDEKLGEDDSAIIVLLKDADWIAVRDMFMRFDAEALKLEFSPEAEKEIAELTADEDVAQAVREEVDIIDQSGDDAGAAG